MKPFRRLFNFLSLISFLIWLLLVFFRFRATALNTTDVWMLPLPKNHSLLITSHCDNWLSFTWLKNFPLRRFAHWSGPGRRNVGPLTFWQIHRFYSYNPSFLNFHPLGDDGFWGHEGSYISPRTAPGAPPEFNRSYDRAVAAGYPYSVSGGASYWYLGLARDINMPFRILIRWTAVLPTFWLMASLLHRRRQRRRRLEKLCLSCGYDLRASVDNCPECGQAFSLPRS